MSININRLLNKKTWTGAEVGKALIASYAHDVRNRNNPDAKPLFTQADFNRMTDGLTTEPQIGTYLVYEKIYSSCIDSYNREQALEQQYLHGYYRLLLSLEQVQQADHAKQATESYPLILSRQQYERILKEEKESKRATEISYNGLLFDYLEYCISHEKEAPEGIRKALEACKKEAATNERILSHYNEDMGEGYYILPDGTESRSCTNEDWQQALKRAYIKEHKLPADISEQDLEKYVADYNGSRHLQIMEMLFKGKDALKEWAVNNGYDAAELEEQDTDDFIEDILENSGSRSRDTVKGLLSTGSLERESFCKWVNTEEVPELTKYDIIAEPDLLMRYSGDIEGDVPEEQQFKEFTEEYPKLYKALNTELKKLHKVKSKPVASRVYTWGELADKGIADYALYTEVSSTDIISHYCKENTKENHQKRTRAAFKGIAVLESGSGYDSCIDEETGDYIEPASPYSEVFSIDSISMDDAMLIEGYVTVLIEPAARYLQAYNAFIEILAETYDIPDILEAKADLTGLVEKARAYNGILYLTFEGMSGSREEKRRKRKLLQDYFPSIDWSSYKPTEEAIQAVKDKLDSLGLGKKAAEQLKNFDAFLNILITGERVDLNE